ncbi:MAG: hypothetical protein WKG03_15255 [Telluria sp.]
MRAFPDGGPDSTREDTNKKGSLLAPLPLVDCLQPLARLPV